ncbi:cupin domain-containing protein [Dyadobacter endophyticus]|uniref:Cupin n=1 Tax=Dyadobacter endophyticus TaxID=1749036 RepID=A0ABQ1YMK8_9BACT|nr:cupin domain-containing protein [Dyadobacter endophyticus]GGH30137.1 cupin [Dyadobacter endophyticus]
METFTEQELIETKALQRIIANPEYTVTFLTTAAESGNRLTDMEIELRPGGGNGLHKHLNFTETFIPIEGALEVQIGKNKLLLEPGEQYTVPIGMPHNFANPGSKPIRFRVVIEPGHKGFEYSLRMLYGLANDGRAEIRTWDDLLRASVILMISDMRLSGTKALINPFLPFLYRLAREKGYDLDMIKKYCI